MKQWRVRLMIVLGALVLAAPAFARPVGTGGKRPHVSTPATTVDGFESKNIEGDGGDPPPGELDDSSDDGHFGW